MESPVETFARSCLADDRGGRFAVHDSREARWYTYAGLRAGAEAVARGLRFHRKGLVFCFAENTVRTVSAYLGAQLAGHAVVLLDARLDPAFRNGLISRYEPEFIAGPVSEAGYERTSVDTFRRVAVRDRAIHSELALLLSTSGSTGTSKLVRLSHSNVMANAQQIRAALSIGPDERAMANLPLYYSYGLSVLNSHLLAGASTVLSGDGPAAGEFWDLIRSLECTSMAGVPYTYQILQRLDLEALNVPRLTTLTQAGGRLHPDLVRTFHSRMGRRGGRFFVMYGQTEATARMAVLPPGSTLEKLGSAGYAVSGGAFSIESDEVVYRGPNVMMGYAAGPDDLARGDESTGCLRTGDLGYLEPDGCLYLSGRLNRFSKVYGLRVNLDEIESMLRTYGPVAAVGGEDRLRIFCEEGGEAELRAHRRLLAQKLRVHPSAFQFQRVDRLPLTASGKTDYRLLEAR